MLQGNYSPRSCANARKQTPDRHRRVLATAVTCSRARSPPRRRRTTRGGSGGGGGGGGGSTGGGGATGGDRPERRLRRRRARPPGGYDPIGGARAPTPAGQRRRVADRGEPAPLPSSSARAPFPRAPRGCRDVGRNGMPGDARRRPGPARARCRRDRRAGRPSPCPRSPDSRRTYVAPPQRVAPASADRSASRSRSTPTPALAAGVALADPADCAFVAQGGSQLERTTWTEVAWFMLAARSCARGRAAARRGSRERPRGCAAAGCSRRSRCWPRSRAVDHVVADARRLVAGDQPDARLPRRRSPRASRSAGSCPGAGARCSTAIALGALVICGWALLTKVFPGALAPDETFARLRPPFEYWNSVGARRGARHPAAAVARRAPLGPRRGQRARLARARAR